MNEWSFGETPTNTINTYKINKQLIHTLHFDKRDPILLSTLVGMGRLGFPEWESNPDLS